MVKTVLKIFVAGVLTGIIVTNYAWTKTKMYKKAKEETEDRLRELVEKQLERIKRRAAA